jgi:hypothetical protein
MKLPNGSFANFFLSFKIEEEQNRLDKSFLIMVAASRCCDSTHFLIINFLSQKFEAKV